MVTGGFAFLLGAALQAAAYDWWMLIVGRILLGVGIGFANEVRMPGSHCACVIWELWCDTGVRCLMLL